MEAVVTDPGEPTAAPARPEGYDAFVAAAAPALLRLAVMLTGSREDGEDLLQSALLKTYRHRDRIGAMDAPVAYLRTAVVNEHTSRGRRSARRVREVPATAALEPGLAPGDDAVALRD